MAIIGWCQAAAPSDTFVRILRSVQASVWPRFEHAAKRPLAPPVLLVADPALLDGAQPWPCRHRRSQPASPCHARSK